MKKKIIEIKNFFSNSDDEKFKNQIVFFFVLKLQKIRNLMKIWTAENISLPTLHPSPLPLSLLPLPSPSSPFIPSVPRLFLPFPIGPSDFPPPFIPLVPRHFLLPNFSSFRIIFSVLRYRNFPHDSEKFILTLKSNSVQFSINTGPGSAA